MRLTGSTACLFAGLVLASPARSQTITTVAGNSSWGDVQNVTVDAAGNMYAADVTKAVVYKIDRLGNTAVVAGNGTQGYSGDGAAATAAQLRQPSGTAVAPDGTLYIAEYGNNRIRKVAPNGIITTFAGTGTAGFTGDGGAATAARIYAPHSMVMDTAGNLFFVDIGNYRIRKIAPNGTITTVAGTGRCPVQSGDGGPATSADSCPGWLALGPDGSLYFTDDGDLRFFGYSRVRKVAPNGVISTVAGTGVNGFNGDGGPARAAQFRGVCGVAVDSAGNLYISDGLNSRIRKVDRDGIITTYAGTGGDGSAGDGGPAIRAQLNVPAGQAFGADGNLYFADRNNVKIRKISAPAGPAIKSADSGVAAFFGQAGFSSNMYMDIGGTNLSQSTRTWSISDFNGPSAPTSLDGVSVTVNGKPAFIRYVSPTQVGIITPDDNASGPVSIQLQSPLGASNVGTINRARVSPTLQTTSQSTFGGKQYVLAQTADFRFFVGSPNIIEGLPFTAVKPGDTVVIYALGCGPTDPSTPAGTIAAQDSNMTLPFELRIGGIPAGVVSAVMVGNTIGLYQFVVTIPSVAGGDQSIELIVDGVSNGQNLAIVVGQ
jgi:uncharacterized protein (TIGR03437 family)